VVATAEVAEAAREGGTGGPLNIVSSYILATMQVNTLNIARNVKWVLLLSVKVIPRVPKTLVAVWSWENTEILAHLACGCSGRAAPRVHKIFPRQVSRAVKVGGGTAYSQEHGRQRSQARGKSRENKGRKSVCPGECDPEVTRQD